jgi:hypothetical protein
MDSFGERMRKEMAVISVGDLLLDHKYRIISLYAAQTKFDWSVKATMEESLIERVEVFLLKSIVITDTEIDEYNDRVEKTLCFVYLDKRGQSFNFKFV